MALVAVSDIKFNGEKIPAGTSVTKKMIDDEDVVKQLVAAGSLAPPKSATAAQAQEAAKELQASEERASQLEQSLAAAEQARAEAEAARQQLEEEYQQKLAEALEAQRAELEKAQK